MIKVLFSLIFPLFLFAGEIKVAAAADLIYAFEEIKKVYEEKHKDDKLKISLGSSGKATTQIINGAPYDIFFSADMKYVQQLKDEGFVVSEPKPYAYGRVGLFVLKDKKFDISKGIELLKDKNIKKIAIADPAHAPYGVAAKNSLISQKYYDLVKDKLVLGENVSQAAQFITSGAADIGIIPISLALSETLKKLGEFYLFPKEWHNEILQGYGVTKNGANNKSVKKFEEFISSKEARVIFEKYGFSLPNE